jgi:hypothetical protein
VPSGSADRVQTPRSPGFVLHRQQDRVDEHDSGGDAEEKDEVRVRLAVPAGLANLGLDPPQVQHDDDRGDERPMAPDPVSVGGSRAPVR